MLILLFYIYFFGILAITRTSFPHFKLIKGYGLYQTGYKSADIVFVNPSFSRTEIRWPVYSVTIDKD